LEGVWTFGAGPLRVTHMIFVVGGIAAALFSFATVTTVKESQRLVNGGCGKALPREEKAAPDPCK